MLEEPERLPRASLIEPLPSPWTGYLAALDARKVAEASIALGAGRTVKDAAIDYAVGIELHNKTGQAVENGQPVLSIHANDAERLEAARDVLGQAIRIEADPVPYPSLIRDILRA